MAKSAIGTSLCKKGRKHQTDLKNCKDRLKKQKREKKTYLYTRSKYEQLLKTDNNYTVIYNVMQHVSISIMSCSMLKLKC